MDIPIRIRILDNEYLLRSDEDSELAEGVAKLVNEKLDEVRQNYDRLSEGKTAILAAFDIACDYLRLMRKQDVLIQEVEDRSRILNRQIESVE